MFPKQPNVSVPVFKADRKFLTKLDQILNIPTNHYSRYWDEHYMTVEIKGQSIFFKVFTSQSQDSRIPNARDNGVIVKADKAQCVTMSYDVEVQCDPGQFTKIINLINNQIGQLKSLHPKTIYNINDISQSKAFNEIKYSVPYKTLIGHEHSIDTNLKTVFTQHDHGIKDLSSDLINQKYPKFERQSMENEIENYIKNKQNLTVTETKKFYLESDSIIKSCKNSPGLPQKLLSDYTVLETKIEQNLKRITQMYN